MRLVVAMLLSWLGSVVMVDCRAGDDLKRGWCAEDHWRIDICRLKNAVAPGLVGKGVTSEEDPTLGMGLPSRAIKCLVAVIGLCTSYGVIVGRQASINAS